MTTDYRIVDIKLDERTILWRNADIEQERRVAIFDLLEGNFFKPLGTSDRVPTQLYNGYGEFVAGLYEGRKAEKLFM